MSNSRAADAIPLTGADCFLRAFDAEVRRFNRSSHLSQLVLRLGPGLDPETLRKRIAEAAVANPILCAPIRRQYGLGAPAYRTAGARGTRPPTLAVHEAPAPAHDPSALPPVFFERLNDRFAIRRGDLLRLDLVRYADGEAGADLAFTWLHMLFDGSGIERFLPWLDAFGQGEAPADAPSAADARLDAETPEVRSSRARGQEAMRWRRFLASFANHPPLSLAGPRRSVPQALRYRLTTFDRSETETLQQRASRKAGFLTPMIFYLAAAIRAHAAVFEARGQDPGSFVVPLPVNLRAKGGLGATFRTHVSLVWFQVLPEQTRDLDELIGELRLQRRRVIQEGLIEAGTAAMNFARIAPNRLYARMARRTLGGELCSFFFGYTDQCLTGLDGFFGAEIRNAFHAPAVPPSPGSSVLMSVRSGRLNLTHVYQEGVLGDDELALFGDCLRRDLLGT